MGVGPLGLTSFLQDGIRGSNARGDARHVARRGRASTRAERVARASLTPHATDAMLSN
jgi:hypothetical protein